MSADYTVIAAGLRELIKYFETLVPATAAEPVADKPAPQKRGRGRPVAGEAQPVAAAPSAEPTTAPTVTASADPFAAAPVPAQPVASLDDVRAAYTALKDAVSQEKALQILKDVGGASNGPELKPEKYDAVVAAFKAAMPAAPVAVADPFETTTAAPAKPLTLEDIRAAIVQAQSRTATDTVQKVLMAHGGKGPLPSGGEGPSLKALPEANFAACLAAIQALPKTK